MISKLSSSSWQRQRQQNYNNKKRWHEDTVSLRIDFILSNIERKIMSSPFPLDVTTYRKYNEQIIVYNESEILEAYRQSLFTDCTVDTKSNYDRPCHHKQATKQPNYKMIEQRSFLICKSCLWCASSYSNRHLQIMPISRCPSCGEKWYKGIDIKFLI